MKRSNRTIICCITVIFVLIVGITLFCSHWLDAKITANDFISYTKEEAGLFDREWPENVDPDMLMVEYVRNNTLSVWYVVKLVGAGCFAWLIRLLYLKNRKKESWDKEVSDYFAYTICPVIFFAK